MAIIRTLGEGYYGVETQGAKIDPVVFERISETFRLVSQTPKTDISLIVCNSQPQKIASPKDASNTLEA